MLELRGGRARAGEDGLMIVGEGSISIWVEHDDTLLASELVIIYRGLGQAQTIQDGELGVC